jgi:dTDP-4-dehydrorhamnose reductase
VNKVLLFGAAGQMGQAIVKEGQARRLSITGLGRDACDIRDGAAVAAQVAQHQPDVIVNCAAYTAVDAAQSEPETAFAINRDGAANVAAACAEAGAALIHLSTDYVFGDGSESARHEADPIGPLNLYGASKADGEFQVQQRIKRHIILRTSWIYGPQSANFFATVMRLAETKDEFSVVTDEFASPTYAPSLAHLVVDLSQKLQGTSSATGFGVFHACGAQAVSRFGFAERIMAARAACGLRTARLLPTTQRDFNAPARRPNYSHLDCGAIRRVYGYCLPGLDDILPTLVRQIAVEKN